MRLSVVLATPLLISSVVALPFENSLVHRQAAGIPQATFDDLAFYFKYASSAYSPTCAKPNGNVLVTMFSDAGTDTQGFIARDTKRKEVVVAFGGSSSVQDWMTDFDVTPVKYTSPGVSAPASALVHKGFLNAWNSVAPKVTETVKKELAANPGFGIVTSGHSLGGAISSLAGISMQQNFPDAAVRMFTYGQPRTGNAAYAKFVNEKLGENVFRSVHTGDLVATVVPTLIGFQHHGVEYHQIRDPANAANTKKCNASGEDPTCSAGVKTPDVIAHMTYFNGLSGIPYCF